MMEIPKGWAQKTINDVLSKKTDSVDVQTNDEYRQIGIRSHGKGIFYKEPVSGLSLGNKRIFWIHPDCFIVNIVFGWEQAVAVTSSNEVGMVASHRFPMYQPKNNACDVEYIEYFFKTKYGKYLLELASPGGAGRNKTLGQKSFLEIPLVLPAIKEQQKIVDILKTWDRAIAATVALIAKSEAQKKALMQQLLTEKRRLPGFDGEWQEVRLEDIVSLWKGKQRGRAELTSDGPVAVINGGISASGYTEESNAPADTITISEGGNSCGYVALQDEAFWCGGHCYALLKPKMDINFLFAQLKHSQRQIMRLRVGSGLPNIQKKDLTQLKLLQPPMGEQKAIGRLFNTCDLGLSQLQAKLQTLKTEKAALMQQLLTGKRRVKLTEVAA